ncbi:MAG: SAM-dependent methyltransferase [Akkermansia sp.]
MKISPLISSMDNWMPIDQFMDIALFDEHGGYYSQGIKCVGYRGDFSTTASQSRILARRLVKEWKQCCKDCGCHLPFIEIGGGSGDLMLDIQREIGFVNRLRTLYYMVEKSPKLRDFQKSVGGGFVRTKDNIISALNACKGRAFIFSNELPDAFPARQFVFQEGEWHELGLAVLDGQITRQAWKRPLPESCVFERWAQEGQVVEVHQSYHQWLASWQQYWLCGAHITIDYGDVNEKLYYRRPAGSLRGYKAHQLLSADELPTLAGQCDITCDVNFSDLYHLAKRIPEDAVRLMNQHDFLKECAQEGDAADAHLIAIPGAGDHFKVLICQRFQL